MRKTIPTLLFAMAAVSMLGGCHAIYRPDVQQGNLLIGKNVSELKPGLTKQQVLALLGTPSVVSPFDQNQWNYLATQQRRGATGKAPTLTPYFDNHTRLRTDGDFMKETPQELLRESTKYGPLYPTNLTKEQQKELEKKQKQGGGG
jgi:outer membrane protein assembly factor BamE